MPNLGATELTILFAVFLLMFGARKLPDLARGTGQALRIFRDETRSRDTDELAPPPVPASGREEVRSS
ncbi:twin-arginine translocase TatA/TatE family subunit [Nocardioides houyundeii]|uniref:twin-arginine translocase TatA/TatE family subunit n=1 Tax=Nocardioides houyundeii TaxID=2045452 RepID=UPI0018F003E4|nr:twin-arginine translocase TatA/TatE family subunit [Nocardioides houyundeii]